MSARTGSLRPVLEREGLTVMPGGCSPLNVMIAQEAGFDAFFVAGSQVSAFLYGVPDVGLIGMRDMAAHVRQITLASSMPILVDGDTGYGNAVGVHYAVEEFIAAGAAGVQFEDQEAPKKSGTGAGRRVVPIAEAVGKYRAAVAARDAIDPDFVICARCDAIGAEGSTFDDALVRCRAYVDDGGADFVWLNSPESLDQIAEVCAAVSAPVMSSWAHPGATPTVEEFAALGLRILVVPTIASSAGAGASWHVLHELKAHGTAALDDWNRFIRPSGWSYQTLQRVLGSPGVRELEREFLPAESQRDYDASFGSMSSDDGGPARETLT
jgi:2-methylisocitrate lyase-like PEP mutase family enzyme